MKITLLFLFVSVAVFAQKWEVLSTNGSCTNRHENSLVGVGHKIVLLGGRGIKPVEILDTKTNTWTKGVNTPIEIQHFQAIEYKGEVWVVGAFTGGYPHEKPIDRVIIYNLEKNEWRDGPAIPKDRLRGSAGVFVYKNKIYMVCGIQDGHWDGHVTWFDEYDPKTDKWAILPDAPRARDHISAAQIGNKTYLAAGRRSTAKTNQVMTITEPLVDVFDFKTKTWKTLPETSNIPTLRAGASAVVLDGKLIVMGGESASQKPSHSDVEMLNPKTMTWTKLSPFLKGRHGTGATVINKKIYTIAGSGNSGGGPELNSVEVYK
jgi:N-acetylneuraminic acid mutarotase